MDLARIIDDLEEILGLLRKEQAKQELTDGLIREAKDGVETWVCSPSPAQFIPAPFHGSHSYLTMDALGRVSVKGHTLHVAWVVRCPFVRSSEPTENKRCLGRKGHELSVEEWHINRDGEAWR